MHHAIVRRCAAVLAFAALCGANAQTASVSRQPGGAAPALTAIAPDASKTSPGKTVLLDAWFNSQKRKNVAGELEYFHYKWQDQTDSGFSIFGQLWRDSGFKTDTLYDEPAKANLARAQVYLLVSPDNPAKNAQPHYMNANDAGQIAAWVADGGVLLMMENDPANADIEHFDLLADKFGLHFNNVLSHHVNGDEFAMGRIDASRDGDLFRHAHVLYMKDTCTITPSGAARALLVDKGDVMIASVKYGKGTVLAVVDPWLYNEYIDDHRLPKDYDNMGGAHELIDWVIQQIPPTRQIPPRR